MNKSSRRSVACCSLMNCVCNRNADASQLLIRRCPAPLRRLCRPQLLTAILPAVELLPPHVLGGLRGRHCGAVFRRLQQLQRCKRRRVAKAAAVLGSRPVRVQVGKIGNQRGVTQELVLCQVCTCAADESVVC